MALRAIWQFIQAYNNNNTLLLAAIRYKKTRSKVIKR
jgi:hypothetical protein